MEDSQSNEDHNVPQPVRPVGGSAPARPPSSPQENDLTGLDTNNFLAALSYLGVLVIIPLLVARHNPYVVFHAKQGLVILVGYILAMFLVMWTSVFGNLLWLVLLLASVAGLIQALRGKRWRMPGISALADKFNI